MMATGVARPRAPWAGDDQHRNAGGNGKLRPLAQKKPDKRGEECNSDDYRDEYSADPVGQLGRSAPSAACLVHQADDLRQSGVVPDLLRFKAEKAGLVDGGGDY